MRIIHKYEIYDINKQYVQIGKTTANASYQQGNDFAQNAIDGKIDHGKRWTNWSNSNNANDQKNDFTITLDQPQDVQAIGIYFFSDRNTHKDGPALIEISTSSDNQTFTPVTNQSNMDKFIANEETYENIISFNKVPKAKYIKLTITNRSKSSGTYYVTGFVELKVYGSSLSLIKDETRKLSEITVGLNQLSEFKPDVYKYSGSSEFIKGFPAVQFKQFQKDKSHLQTIIYDIDESHRVYKAILTSENGEKTVYEYEHTLMTDKIKKFKVIIDPIYVGLQQQN
ncbi:discoidin domain-containing protein [Mycoplasmopsis cynos]|uniref:discoidin domain-containing protein n=1 Tax=Mycoplasmopsis cynos TaxID=171284 RepID=UPI002FF1A71B